MSKRGGEPESRSVVIAGGSRKATSLVSQAATDEMRVNQFRHADAVLRQVAGKSVDAIVADESAWQPILDAEPDLPVVLLAADETLVETAINAGVSEVVRLSDPAAESLLAARLSQVIDTRQDRVDQARRQEWLETLMRHSTDSMSVLDENGTAIYNSPAVADQLGYEPAELRGQNLLDQVHPDDAAEVRTTFTDLIEKPDGSYATATYRRQHADGSWRWMETVGNVQLDNPRIGGVVVNRRDVTEREQRQRQLRDQEAYVESLLDGQPDVFYVLDTNGFFQKWNARLSEVLGYDDKDLTSMHAVETIVPEDRERIMTAMTAVYQEQSTQQRESAFLTADGERIPYQLNGAPLTDSDGKVIGLVGTGRDISERVRREERLSVLNRVLRHNLRNRTNVVIGHARTLANSVDDPDAVKRAKTIRDVGSDLNRLGVLARKVDQALDGQSDQVPMDLDEVVSRAATALPESADTRIADPPDVQCEALASLSDALEEVFDNAVRHNPADNPSVTVAYEIDPDRVTIAVADDGPKIPDHEMAVLDDGESRLKHGGGLGLWFINWVVDASGGELSFDESELGGNCVSLHLPRAEKETSKEG
ncbi:PAS domain S-box protein [Halobellus ruber]|uniref:histidine kinase n=1 Tax=Halobellus ruber TaxID=2761102 RepID=A0A7J9SMH7_9EURY|nr:PAS domain S-box protein [Halobellus ruber]MBB6647928.1 PAS domain S-box protein [Halobellus ruber]